MQNATRCTQRMCVCIIIMSMQLSAIKNCTPMDAIRTRVIIKSLSGRFIVSCDFHNKSLMNTENNMGDKLQVLLYVKQSDFTPSKSTVLLDASYIFLITRHILPFTPMSHNLYHKQATQYHKLQYNYLK